MTHDYIPDGEEIFYNWQENLSTTVAANAVAWNIPTTKITELGTFKSPYKAAYDAANSGKKNIRTTQQVLLKQTTQKAYEKYLRRFIKEFLAYNSAVTDEDRSGLQITVKDTVRTASTTPVMCTRFVHHAAKWQPHKNCHAPAAKPKWCAPAR